MLAKTLTVFLCALASIDCCGVLFRMENEGSLLIITDKLKLILTRAGAVKLSAQLDINLVSQRFTPCASYDNINCVMIGDVKLDVRTNGANGFVIEWSSSNTSSVFRDCYDLKTYTTSWFGGPERFVQLWPIERLELTDFANVPQELNWSAITEPYWLNSLGAYIFVDGEVPLFIDQNVGDSGQVCFVAKIERPYTTRSKVSLKYTIFATDTPRNAHMNAVQYFLGKPTGTPNMKMIQRPVWSTWARYKRDISDDIILEFANEIVSNGYSDGQFEIDDYWETCYGSLTFRSPEFDNINDTVKAIKDLGFRVTLWIHPFINVDCPEWSNIASANGYLVLNENGSTLTQWWNTGPLEAQYIDFTKPAAAEWFYNRLLSLQQNHGIDSFKFDAGETSWAPQVPVLQGRPEDQPNNLCTDYVRTCARFGDLVEVRAGWKTQDLPVFVRMIDKDSYWGTNNGLYTLITTLLQMNMNGYSLVLPDMVGGNGYFGIPSAELFIRWLQANTFMPAIQFSYVPWDYANVTQFDVVAISETFVALHTKYAAVIMQALQNSTRDGVPTNAPVWWVDKSPNRDTYLIDTQYMLGEDVLVAPVIVEGATSRDVYIPSGNWIDGNTMIIYQGNRVLSNYSAPINILPYFIRQGSSAELVLRSE